MPVLLKPLPIDRGGSWGSPASGRALRTPSTSSAGKSHKAESRHALNTFVGRNQRKSGPVVPEAIGYAPKLLWRPRYTSGRVAEHDGADGGNIVRMRSSFSQCTTATWVTAGSADSNSSSAPGSFGVSSGVRRTTCGIGHAGA